MFRLSRAAEYSIRGLLQLTIMEGKGPQDVDAVSKAQDVPKAYLSKLFQQLAKKGFIKSARGPEGGFVLAKSSSDITLLAVVEAMEGPIFLNVCLISIGYCERDKTCPVHDVWGEAQKAFLEVLKSCTFSDLAKRGKEKIKNEVVVDIAAIQINGA